MMSSAPTPRTPKGWVRLLLSIVGWAALGIVTLGTIAWVFFGTYGLTMYFIAVAYLLIAVACGAPALLFMSPIELRFAAENLARADR